MIRCLFVALMFALCALCVRPVSACAAPQTPEAVLTQIQRSIDEADLPSFERHVDVDAPARSKCLGSHRQPATGGKVNTSGLPPMLALMVASVQDPSMAKQSRTFSCRKPGPSSARTSNPASLRESLPPPTQGLLAPLFGTCPQGARN